MPTVQEMTEQLKQFVQNGKTVLDYFTQERMSLQMFKEEVNHLIAQKEEILKRNAEIEEHNEDLRKQGDQILSQKKAEADQLINIARENLVAAARDREKAKQELLKAEEKAYLADKNRDNLIVS